MVIIAATVHFMRMGMTNVGVASRTQQDDFWSFFVLIEASFAPTQNMTKQQVISLVCCAGGPQANTSYSTQSAIDASPSAVFFTTVQLESTGCSLSTQNQNESHWSESMTINLYMNQHESTWINMQESNEMMKSQDWCAAVIKPCSAVSEGHCCQEHSVQQDVCNKDCLGNDIIQLWSRS